MGRTVVNSKAEATRLRLAGSLQLCAHCPCLCCRWSFLEAIPCLPGMAKPEEAPWRPIRPEQGEEVLCTAAPERDVR